MTVNLTVAICTYNGANRIAEVLEHLKQQIDAQGISWEVLVIDNNSHDATVAVVHQYQKDWLANVPLILISEHRQGLAYARRQAIAQAQGSWIAFLDDDNLPSPNWVAAAYAFSYQHPQAGACGSKVLGQYEQLPPPNFERIASCLAVVDPGPFPFRYDQMSTWRFPPGAGLLVRKQAWQLTVPQNPVLAGVQGESLQRKGEDLETLTHMRKAGMEIWYNPQMQIYHKIPAQRLQRDYLMKLCQGIGLSRYPIRIIRFPPWQRSLIIPVFFLRDLMKLLSYYLFNWRSIGQDLVVDCELELLRTSLMSFTYYWRLWVLPFFSK